MKKSKYIKVRKIMMMIVNSLFFHFYCVIKSIKTIFIKLLNGFFFKYDQASKWQPCQMRMRQFKLFELE